MDDCREAVTGCSGGRAFQREDRTHTEGPGSGDSIAGGVGGADRRPRHFTESQQKLLSRTVLRSGLTYSPTMLLGHLQKGCMERGRGQSSRVDVTGAMDG